MTAPGAGYPDKYDQLGGISSLQDGKAKALAATNNDLAKQADRVSNGFFGFVGDILGNVARGVNDLFNFLFPQPDDGRAAPLEVHDGQLVLNDDETVLEDVSGYATTFMPANIFRDGNGQHIMPFTEQLGPTKNATIVAAGGMGGIELERGTWQIFAQMTTDQHDNYLGIMRIQVLDDDQNLYSEKEIQQYIERDKWNVFQAYHPVVCKERGYFVQITFEYRKRGIATNLLIRGGTNLTHLSVNRLDLRTTDDRVEDDPDTEPDPDDGEETD